MPDFPRALPEGQTKTGRVGKRADKMEREYYETIKEKLEELFKAKFTSFHLEVTANKKFSNKLKAKVSEYREIIFYFLKEAAPDITGFIEKQYSTDFIVVEVKRDVIKLDDIYQTRKYAELFDARYALLISTKEIPEEIKRLSKPVYSLLSLPAYKRMAIVQYDEEARKFVQWFEGNPFEKEYSY
jgi:mRNA-degrading endonuclease RelE of RelBE toxin-antitoxin system